MMNLPNLVKSTEINPDEFFKEEEQFSDWLNEHLDELSDVLNISLEEGEREKRTGRYSTDIVARDADSDTGSDIVIIENQIKQTNHDHLGKLITYAAGHDAKTIIWISPEFTDEHIEALQWLNANSSDKTSFFGIRLQLIKIENSPVSPIFSLIVQPPYWNKRNRPSESVDEVQKTRLKLQEYIIDEYKKIATSRFTARAKPIRYLKLGRTGNNFDLFFFHHKMLDRLSVGIRIRKLKRSTEEIEKFFNELKKHQHEIEEEFGEPLDWQVPNLESKQTRYWIRANQEIDDNLENLPEPSLLKLAEWASQKIKRFTEVFPKFENLQS